MTSIISYGQIIQSLILGYWHLYKNTKLLYAWVSGIRQKLKAESIKSLYSRTLKEPKLFQVQYI